MTQSISNVLLYIFLCTKPSIMHVAESVVCHERYTNTHTVLAL